jgi:dTDP-4-amino-4,6-dideoxygalactose transaminase
MLRFSKLIFWKIQMPNIPNVYDAEPIPHAAMAEVKRILGSGELFRYTADQSPVAQLESEFAAMMGSKYALAVSSCSAALFLALKAIGLPRDARVLIPAFTFGAVPSAVVHAECIPVLCECGDNYRIDLEDLARPKYRHIRRHRLFQLSILQAFERGRRRDNDH